VNRFFTVNCILLALFAVLVYRLFEISIFERGELLAIAKKQHNIVIELEAKRGNILDHRGKLLATTIKSPSVYAIPRLIPREGKTRLIREISRILNLDPAWVATRLQKDKAFVWLKRKVSDDEAEGVLNLANPNLAVQNESKRFYPHSEGLAHVLGFCNIDNEGLEGLELAYDEYLKGEKGFRKSKRDALGRELPVLEEKFVPPINGRNVILHIDQFIQHVVERELDKSFTQWNAQGACAIVMEPSTGHILAMASRPSFNPNLYGNSPVANRRNRCLTDFYEPGSIFKVMTMAAALSENKVQLDDSIFCENGSWAVTRSRVIHDVHPYGRLLIPEILIKSSNIGTVKIGRLVGEPTLYQYIKKFGFGELSGIDLKGEVAGIVHPLRNWSKISITSVPYGQEVAATALQMVRAISVIANGGYLVQPVVMKEIQDESGTVVKRGVIPAKERIIEKEVTLKINDMLVRVVDEGTGQNAKIKGVSVAGKTGTAQKINPQGGYSHSNFISSFMGYAPADNPLLAMIVMVDDPHPSYYGGTVAAPVFKVAMEESLLHLGYIPPAPEAPSPAPSQSLKQAATTPVAAVVR
jgi:cell division protein FtsI (penicillin-binding protein 3)